MEPFDRFPWYGHRLVVSIPVDLSANEELAKIEEKGTKGRYVSVERLLELEDGKVEWRMATSSTPGGIIPSFISESSLPGQIAAVCVSFRDHCHTTHFDYRMSHIFSSGSTPCARKGIINTLAMLHNFIQLNTVSSLTRRIPCGSFTRARDIFPLEDNQRCTYYAMHHLYLPSWSPLGSTDAPHALSSHHSVRRTRRRKPRERYCPVPSSL